MPGPLPDIAFTLPGPETITLSGEIADKLIRAGDGDAALLYLYVLKTGGRGTSAEAAAALKKDAASISKAMAVLSRLGLIQYEEPAGFQQEKRPIPSYESAVPSSTDLSAAYPASAVDAKPVGSEPDVPMEPSEPKRYSAAELTSEMKPGSDFSILVEEIQRSLGKILSPDELERLFGIFDSLRLPSDVILQLVTHCITESRGRGGGRMPSMRYIEKAAYTWEREGIFSLDRAEEYLKAHDARKSAHGEIAQALHINDREMSTSEKRYVDSWISLGFKSEAIEIAYDRTVLKTGKLAWGYINSIINNWHEKNIHTAQDIQEKDGKQGVNGAASKTSATDRKFGAPDNEDIKRMEQILKRIKEQ